MKSSIFSVVSLCIIIALHGMELPEQQKSISHTIVPPLAKTRLRSLSVPQMIRSPKGSHRLDAGRDEEEKNISSRSPIIEGILVNEPIKIPAYKEFVEKIKLKEDNKRSSWKKTLTQKADGALVELVQTNAK
jgi:hypothetical protein